MKSLTGYERKTALAGAFLLLLLLSARPAAGQGAPFIRGDLDQSGNIQMVDAVRVFGFLFLSEPASIGCEDVADGNDDGRVNIADGSFLLNFVFLGGGRPPHPGFECLTDHNCAETALFQPGYDLTIDDPFTCGDAIVVGGDRPVAVHVPPNYDPSVPMPLVLALHGFGSSGAWRESYRQFRPLADSRGFIYAHPNGTLNIEGDSFWNATSACCSLDLDHPDDSAYLRGLIEEIATELNVDPLRVYLNGQSNGGFMSHCMACDHSDTIAAIAAIAGMLHVEPEKCRPTDPINILHIHGTADNVILFEGGSIPRTPGPYPGAVETVERWASHNDCLPVQEVGESLDFEAHIDGAETLVTRYRSGCNGASTVEFWRILGGRHVPALFEPFNAIPHDANPRFSEAIIDWLLAHPKRLAARFTMADGSAPREVCVSDAGSLAIEGTEIVAHDWDLGDGETAEGPETCHTYTYEGPYRIRLTVTNELGEKAYRGRIVEFPFTAGDVLPWSSADIGTPDTPGAARPDQASLLVRSGGRGFFTPRNEEFHFLHQKITGDVTITARISDLFPLDGTHAAGVMLRQDLADGTRHATLLLSNRGDSHHMEFVRRRSFFSTTNSSADLTDRWVRIERRGSEFIGFHSADGVSWTELARETIDMPETVFGGIAVTALSDEDNETVLAKIDDLEVSTP